MKKSPKEILLGVTAKKGKGWEAKLEEIKKYKIKKFALFIEEIKKPERERLYKSLIDIPFRIEIPFVHIREDVTKEELKFLLNRFNSKYFNIHETHFHLLNNWKGFNKKLYVEMDYNDYISKNVNLNKIGGFCIDLSHFKASQERQSKEYEYVLKRKNYPDKFVCNHLNGYSYEKKEDLHYIKNIKDFDYLVSLPKFVFGSIIALEMYNPISEQIEYKKYITKLLNKKFKIE